MPESVLKVCGGWVGGDGGGWWLRPILVFSLSLDQAEQYVNFPTNKPLQNRKIMVFLFLDWNWKSCWQKCSENIYLK